MNFRLLLLLVFICINLEESAAKLSDGLFGTIKYMFKSDYQMFMIELNNLVNKSNPVVNYMFSMKIPPLGGDGSSSVQKAKSVRTDAFVAIKKIDITSPDTKIYIINEIKVMKEIKNHGNIVKYMDSYLVKTKKTCRYTGFVDTEKVVWIVMEYMDYGSLIQIVENLKMNEAQIAYVCREVLKGLEYMHGISWIHRDIKSQNIMLGSDASVKLADFGNAVRSTAKDLTKTLGSPEWMAPEVAKGQKYGKMIDVWSLGIMAIEMFTQKTPYSGNSDQNTINLIKRNNGIPMGFIKGLGKNETITDHFKEFLNICLQVEASDRKSAAELLKHSFLKMAVSPRDFQELMKTAKETANANIVYFRLNRP